MALKIRLARGGAKKDPHYSIVVIESHRKRDGKFVEKLGHYHPTASEDIEKRVVINAEQVKHWLSCGALPTERVVFLLEQKGFSVPEKYKTKPKVSKNAGMSKKQIAQAKKEVEEKLKAAQKAKAEAKKAAEAAEKAAQQAKAAEVA